MVAKIVAYNENGSKSAVSYQSKGNNANSSRTETLGEQTAQGNKDLKDSQGWGWERNKGHLAAIKCRKDFRN